MPCLALLVSALYLKSFATWLKLHINEDGDRIKKNSLKVSQLLDPAFADGRWSLKNKVQFVLRREN